MFHVEQILGITGVMECKKGGALIAFLLLHLTEVYAPAQDTGWGACLEAAQLDPDFHQACR
jgi:hypothetical protein